MDAVSKKGSSNWPQTTKTIAVSDLEADAKLLGDVLQAADLDGDGATRNNELERIRVRDSWVTRDALGNAQFNASYGTDDWPSNGATVSALARGVRSAVKADADGDGMLTPDELGKASRTARWEGLFSEKHHGAAIEDFKIKQWSEPGTRDYRDAARRNYEKFLDLYGQPQFPSGLLVDPSKLPEQGRATFEAFTAAHPGDAKICETYFENTQAYAVNVRGSETHNDVLLMDPAGNEVSTGALERGEDGHWKQTWQSAQ